MKEEWKNTNIHHYWVSNTGFIKNNKTGKILKSYVEKSGYASINLLIDSKRTKTFRVHRLVAIAFLSNQRNYLYVNHKDGNKLNNHYMNLEWVTQKENIHHAIQNRATSNFKFEFKNHQTKLSDVEVEYIRQVYIPSHSEFGTKALGIKFGVSRGTISAIANHKERVPRQNVYVDRD